MKLKMKTQAMKTQSQVKSDSEKSQTHPTIYLVVFSTSVSQPWLCVRVTLGA